MCEEIDVKTIKTISKSVDNSTEKEVPFCRICFEDKSAGRLKSFCECRGSVGSVHRKCLEKWFLVSHSDRCEICGTQMDVKLVYGSLIDWICDFRTIRFLLLDILSLAIIIPLFIRSLYLLNNIMWQKTTLMTAIVICVGISIIMLLLFTVIYIWLLVCIVHHINSYIECTINGKVVIKPIKSQNQQQLTVSDSDSSSGGNQQQHRNDLFIRVLSFFRCSVQSTNTIDFV
ncbi:E3 ubiquitin-protein ligase MARCHF2-like [Oppia nitens]|uniref:E3 ubiquitin-protein ligase MARCHF2-like n=1 Tax=Oppia nitens TaxID=1686743 RepID=UPI0023DC3C1F|nr:E3 ubiquitin-protein ligase MARCHF2-like [Oppia nitens]